jgi:iron complex outermembrane receptor protein
LTLIDAETDIPGIACFPGQTTISRPAGGTRDAGICYRETQPNGSVVVSQDVRGGDIPNSPDVRLSLTGRWERDLASLPFGLFVQTSLLMQDDVIFAADQDPLTRQDGYAVVDASIGLASDDNRWTLTLFVENSSTRITSAPWRATRSARFRPFTSAPRMPTAISEPR